MTKDELIELAQVGMGIHSPNAPEYIVCAALIEALAQPEPVKISHKHEWFRTGEMKVGQMRCISCGTWGQEEMPQRPWVGLTKEERHEISMANRPYCADIMAAHEEELKRRNT